MVLDALAEKLDVKVSQADVTNFLASIAQQYGMDPSAFIQAIVKNGQLGSAVQEVGRSKGLLAGMRAVTFKSEGETLDLSSFLGEAAEDEESESVEPPPPRPPSPTSSPRRTTRTPPTPSERKSRGIVAIAACP